MEEVIHSHRKYFQGLPHSYSKQVEVQTHFPSPQSTTYCGPKSLEFGLRGFLIPKGNQLPVIYPI